MAGLTWKQANEVEENVFDTVDWEKRTASLPGVDGGSVFEQKDVEVPESWSQNALNIAVSRYFRGHIGQPNRETSIRQLITRVVTRIGEWAHLGGYFATPADRNNFLYDLTILLLHQKAAFNSPVWFNLGADSRKQAASACYIVSVEDTMESILDLAKTEGMLFKDGSGSGSNLSTIRAENEELTSGGTASGPVSFMRGLDAFAGIIKSGGSVRRAAKMVQLNVDHPDIMKFIRCKAEEEKKIYALVAAGYDGKLDSDSYASIAFQNANNSVRVTNEFMRAVEDDEEWNLYRITDGTRAGTIKARELMREIAKSTHACGDPGIQFHNTINKWHTCAETGPINASNPCGEFVFLDDTACNLASLNLKKFCFNGRFDTEEFKHAVRTMITAQEILVGYASYPTEKITKNSHEYRPLGLGYANLGALLMTLGLPYDSDEGRDYAASITALMTGEAYHQSAIIARDCGGPFEGYYQNKHYCNEVVQMHADAASKQLPEGYIKDVAEDSWDNAINIGHNSGYRNAQVTVLAPTGTIGFMMDCDTTGIEPDYSLVKHKYLVGGGTMEIVNSSLESTLINLNYDKSTRVGILNYIKENKTIEGAPGLKPQHLSIFDCANTAGKGTRSIAPEGHLLMVSRVQPFISGAISKTINLPEDATVEDIEKSYMMAWELGIKAVSIYRHNSKQAQPLDTKSEFSKPSEAPHRPLRRRLPDERQSITHRFEIAGKHKGYICVGLYEDGRPGEIFITLAKGGSTISGLVDSFAQAISYCLQYNVPLESLVNKFSHVRFEPSGFTKNSEIPSADSVVDYIFRWLESKFLKDVEITEKPDDSIDGHPCASCGALMVRSGACFTCPACGETGGCG